MTPGEGDDRGAAEASDGGPEARPGTAEPAADGGVAGSAGTPAEDAVDAALDAESPPEAADADTAEAIEEDEATLSRRELFGYAGGVGAGLGGWKALDNVVLGYGVLMGTNLLEQDLPAYLREDLAVRETAVAVDGHEIRTDGESIAVADPGSGDVRTALDVAEATPADAEAIEAEYGLSGSPLGDLLADVRALADGDVRFEFSTVEPFVERVRSGDARPLTVAALRGPAFDSPDAEFVGEFADTDPADLEALVPGLAEGFRTYTYYDVPRYAAGSVEDNVLLGTVDLRQYFESPTGFEALVEGENSGLFCTELVARSIEAFHAVAPTAQSPPVAAGFVSDQRHKHAYTVLVSAIREDGDLVLPATFVDYTHSTLYHDLRLTWLLGEGIEAYNDRHRATYVRWNRYPSI